MSADPATSSAADSPTVVCTNAATFKTAFQKAFSTTKCMSIPTAEQTTDKIADKPADATTCEKTIKSAIPYTFSPTQCAAKSTTNLSAQQSTVLCSYTPTISSALCAANCGTNTAALTAALTATNSSADNTTFFIPDTTAN